MQSVGTFTFLTDDWNPNLTAEKLRKLSIDSEMSGSDKDIANEICDFVETTGQLPFELTSQENNYLRKHHEQKWIKYLIYRYKFVLYPKRKILAEFPVYLLIEPTSVCNLRCVMCFQVDKSFTRQPYMGMMDFELFKRVVDEAVTGGTGGVTLASRGEPTLHKQLPEMLDYLAGKFYEIKLTTNATRLDETLIHRIFQAGVNIVVFSVDAHTKSLYEEIRVRGNFDKVYKNIEMFHEIRAKYYPESQTTSRISAVKFREDQDSVGFAEFWKELVDEVGMKGAAARWDTYNNSVVQQQENACGYLWERLYIWYDGLVSPCDADYKSSLATGDLARNSIRDVWHGERLNEIRELHIGKQRRQLYPCDRCGITY